MDAAWQAMAEAGAPVRTPVWDSRLFWLTLVLAAVILIGALLIAWLDRWRKHSGSERLSANDQLANFRALYEKGQLSEEEFEKIRELLSQQLRRELDVRAGPPASAAGHEPETSRPAEPGNPPD
jgi:hypothetical protein